MLFILPLPLIIYAYQIVGGVFIIQQWIPSGNEVLQITFYNAITFFELVDTENDNYGGHLTSWSLQYFFGPKKLVCFADLFYIATLSIAGQWGGVAYLIVPLIPTIILEWIVYPIFPMLDVPPIPFEDW